MFGGVLMDLFAVAKISAVYPERKTAKVYREDIDLVTGELAILNRGDNWIPEVGEYVACLFVPRSSSMGYILGADRSVPR
jgi:hypothetical protein